MSRGNPLWGAPLVVAYPESKLLADALARRLGDD